MAAGCFLWCRQLAQWFFARSPQRLDGKTLHDHESAVVARKNKTQYTLDHLSSQRQDEISFGERGSSTAKSERFSYTTKGTPEFDSHQRSIDDPGSRLPLKPYFIAAGKEVLAVLQTAAGIIPVPMLQEAIGIALKIIELCEDASAVEHKAKDLQARVGFLMVVVLAQVTDKYKDGDTSRVLQAAKDFEDDIQELLITLSTIDKELVAVMSQNRGLLIIFKDVNMGTLNACLYRLSIALEKFKLANDLRDSDLLMEVHTRLETMTKQVDSISRDIKHVVTTVDNIQQNFDQVIAKVQRSATLHSSDTLIWQTIPLKPGVFYGRESLVDDIAKLLTMEETSRVCILGPGGMGKTSVSLAVVESSLVRARFQEKCIWVPCIGATSAALLLEILHVQLQVPGDDRLSLEKVISKLSNSDVPQLILFDNFETPWNAPGGTQKEVEDILRQLARLSHIAILMTMRGSYPPCDDSIAWQSKNIQPTDEEACFRMYHAINPTSKDDPDVGRLLHALGYMPFAVTLVANLGKEGRSSAGELLQAWSESGTDIISDNPEKSMNRSISLSVDSDLVKQSPNAVLLLSILSLLPAGTTKENLRWWAPTLKVSMLPSAIATLSEAALLFENQQQDLSFPILSVVPVVQSFMQQHGRIPYDLRKHLTISCCQYVLDHARLYDDPDFLAKSNALAREDTNIQAVLFGSHTFLKDNVSEQIIEALLAFCWYRCDTKPSPDLAQQLVAVTCAFGIDKYIALAEWCLGRTYHFLSKYPIAYEHLSKAHQLFDSPGDLQWRKLGGQCAVHLVHCARRVTTVSDVLGLAHSVEARCSMLSDDKIHGRSLLQLGFILQKSDQEEEAMSHLSRAQTLLEAAGNALDIAEVYQAIGRLHLQKGRISEAVRATEEAWRQAERSRIPSIQAEVSLELGSILYTTNCDGEAMKFIEIGLVMSSQVGNIGELASALEFLGYGYLRRGDYHDAYSAYDAAAKKYVEAGTHAGQHVERCKANCRKIQAKQSNSEEVIGFERPFWDSDKSLFYYASTQPAEKVT